MAQFQINFKIESVREGNQDPYYRVTLTTGILGSSGIVDGALLIVERKSLPDGNVDVFYGIAKAADFTNLRKGSPNPGQTFYRTHAWNLVFYNQRTMDDALALMKSQVDILAEDVTIYTRATNNRSETHLSSEF
jgi:hypothetical protein